MEASELTPSIPDTARIIGPSPNELSVPGQPADDSVQDHLLRPKAASFGRCSEDLIEAVQAGRSDTLGQ